MYNQKQIKIKKNCLWVPSKDKKNVQTSSFFLKKEEG